MRWERGGLKSGFPGVWVLDEAEERPAGQSLAEQIKDYWSLQWYLPKHTMNLDLQGGCRGFLHFEYPSPDYTQRTSHMTLSRPFR